MRIEKMGNTSLNNKPRQLKKETSFGLSIYPLLETDLMLVAKERNQVKRLAKQMDKIKNAIDDKYWLTSSFYRGKLPAPPPKGIQPSAVQPLVGSPAESPSAFMVLKIREISSGNYAENPIIPLNLGENPSFKQRREANYNLFMNLTPGAIQKAIKESCK